MKNFNLEKKKVETLLDKVRTSFPEIIGDIKIDHSDYVNDINIYLDYKEGEVKIKDITLVIPKKFPELFYEVSQKEKEAIIAHELGHLERMIKIKNIKKLNRIRRWGENFEEIIKGPQIYLNSETTKNQALRLIKRQLLEETYADIQAAKRGYTKGLLTYLKRFQHKNKLFKNRIENLEKYKK